MRRTLSTLLLLAACWCPALAEDAGYDEVMKRAEVDPPDQPLDDKPFHAVTVTILAKEITYGADGPPEPVWLTYSPDGDHDVRRFGNGKQVAAGQSERGVFTTAIDGFTLVASTPNRTVASDQTDVMALKAHDDLAAFLARRKVNPAFGHQQEIAQILKPYLGADGKLVLGDNQRLVLFELGGAGPTDPSYDLQDLVVLLTFDQPAKHGDF
jgi:hypothetical protein